MHQLFMHFAATCKGGDFLGFPKWYRYLDGQLTTDSVGNQTCAPTLNHINDIWLIVAAVIELLLRVAAIGAIAYVIVGSIQFIASQGDPAKTQAARQTVFNALIGLVMAIGAATTISYVAGRFT